MCLLVFGMGKMLLGCCGSWEGWASWDAASPLEWAMSQIHWSSWEKGEPPYRTTTCLLAKAVLLTAFQTNYFSSSRSGGTPLQKPFDTVLVLKSL